MTKEEIDREWAEDDARFEGYNGQPDILVETALYQMLRSDMFFFHFNKDSMRVTVCCNDIFAWACADAENIESEQEFIALYAECRDNLSWGPVKWSCLKRNEQPQRPVADDMKKAGVWCGRMEALPLNWYDTISAFRWDRENKKYISRTREECHAEWVRANAAAGKTLNESQLKGDQA